MWSKLQADPTARGDEVSLPLASSLQNPFPSSLLWKVEQPHRQRLSGCPSRWAFFCAFLRHPQVKPRLAAKNQIPELELEMN